VLVARATASPSLVERLALAAGIAARGWRLWYCRRTHVPAYRALSSGQTFTARLLGREAVPEQIRRWDKSR